MNKMQFDYGAQLYSATIKNYPGTLSMLAPSIHHSFHHHGHHAQ